MIAKLGEMIPAGAGAEKNTNDVTIRINEKLRTTKAQNANKLAHEDAKHFFFFLCFSAPPRAEFSVLVFPGKSIELDLDVRCAVGIIGD